LDSAADEVVRNDINLKTKFSLNSKIKFSNINLKTVSSVRDLRSPYSRVTLIYCELAGRPRILLKDREH
jgi:hypothetical protein